jgi:hypothetical protein
MEKVLKKIPKQSFFSHLAGKTVYSNIFFTVGLASTLPSKLNWMKSRKKQYSLRFFFPNMLDEQFF